MEGSNGRIEWVEDIMARHKDEWVYFEVKERDEYERPLKGILIAHDPDRDRVHEAMKRMPVREAAVFYTGEPVPAGAIVLL